MIYFRSFIEKVEAFDSIGKIKSYTWTNRREGLTSILEMMGRFFVRGSCLKDDIAWAASILPLSIFDHYPM